ncbi:synaptotagmin-4-like [Oppia nitens]|uniref:synaptotagmin-4-like n=1 Tax=Oppia nitens TaxID=1686743 RepID=UPI0023DA5999|nr:synaptotagmin-4-like [Oppia nitens]
MKRFDPKIRPPHYGPEVVVGSSLHSVDNNSNKNNNINQTNNQSAATAVVAVCLGSAFFILVVAATTCYFYRRRKSDQFGHKTLLIKRNIPVDQSLSFKKSSAVKSPGSGGGLLKKSPSPTGNKSPPGCNSKSLADRHSSSPNNTSPIIDGIKEVVIPIENHVLSDNFENEDKENVYKDKNETYLGKLYFKLKYNYEKRALCVTIIKCSDLPPKDPNFGSSDPYIKLQLLPEKQHKVKTRVLRKTQNPVYDEDFTFYGINPNHLQTTVLHFIVLSFDRYSRDEVIGEVFCHLNSVEFDSLEKQIHLTKEISPRSHKMRLQGRGELLVSLCYQPAANRLTVVILKARNLPKMDLTGLCDPYVKIYLLHNNQRIIKKRTHVKKRTTSPVFNESFVFDIPYNEGLDNVSIEFMVLDYDRLTKNEVIGKLELGPKTGSPTQQKHWQDVIASPRRQIAEWHKLKE